LDIHLFSSLHPWIFLVGHWIFIFSLLDIQFLPFIINGFVKSPFGLLFVIPAKAGIQLIQAVLDSCFRRSDGFSDFLRDHQS